IVEAACAIRKDPQENEHLVAYYVPVGDRIPDEEYLHASMVRLLPDYMLPSHMVKVKEIPKNKSGKADMTSLPDPVWHTDIGGIKKLPGDETEKSLVEIFEKTLKISPIGVEDNFLKLGGNSLLLFVAFSEVEKKFNLKIDLKTATDSPNISSLARIIRQENKA
ncbi:MAG TPA: phosphopantetheine-binding protein, partial [Bacteroidales bacterium]|nr:phosphopantetheine-binding protein [Bacteroidales bacterium]